MTAKSNYQENVERTMKIYSETLYSISASIWCCDPLMKHPSFQRLFGNQPIPFAEDIDVNDTLNDLAWILEGARPLNYIEVANTFPICCQSMVAQYDSNLRSGVTHFAHTRHLRMCKACLQYLREKIGKFRARYPEIISLLVSDGLDHLTME